MFTYKWAFAAAGRSWRVRAKVGVEVVRISVFDGDATTPSAEKTLPSTDPAVYDPHTLRVDTPEGPLDVTVGYLDWVAMGCVAQLAGADVYCSTKRAWGKFDGLKKIAAQSGQTPEERAAVAARMKARTPSIAVDLAMGVLFFVLAKQFGLTTAAVTGAAVTVVLFGVQRLIRVDLLGGLAVFGVVLSLLSAGAALAFQSDLAVKLRGTVIGGIGALAFLTDAAFGGRYLGVRMVGYLETLMRLRPARASAAMGVAGLAVAVVDLAAIFSLSTDHWLIYNATLDGLVAMPIVFACLWVVRERTGPA
ncbi:MAG: septation protein IspZ [Alphaproteobacteria bacterium]|nr:septation protein IspZ [Alphaproteobacteria bacterium]